PDLTTDSHYPPGPSWRPAFLQCPGRRINISGLGGSLPRDLQVRPSFMSYPMFIARRYLLAQRKQAIIYVISLISVLGVIVGVAALVVVLALMTGFQDQIQEKIFGANAHLTIFSSLSGRPLEDIPTTLARLKECEPVQAASPVVYEKGMATSQLN